MKNKWMVIGIAAGLLGILLIATGILYGCGQGGTSSGTATAQTVTISGTVAASQSDLAQLGATSLSVKADSLKNRGVTASSVKALNLVPLATSGAAISIGTLNTDGGITEVASAVVESDGSYSAEILNYDPSKTYQGVVTKTSTDTNKTMEMKVLYPKAAIDLTISGTNAEITPQTTMVAQMIYEKVVKVLENSNVNPEIISAVKDAIITAVDVLVESGSISLTTVRDSTATENQNLKTAIDKAANDDAISNNLDAVKGSLGLTKATDLASAKGAMFELFKMMTGDPKGIPGNIVESFAQAYMDGTTKTMTEIAAAYNNALFNPTTQLPVVGTFTGSQVATEIQNMLNYIYSASSAAPGDTPPAGVIAVVKSVFPKSVWQDETITAATVLSVPQILVTIFVGEKVASENNLGFNPAQVAYQLGLMSGIEDEVSIVHSDLRIVSYEDWENLQPGQQPQTANAIASFVEAGNSINPSADQTLDYTCFLTYPNNAGSTTTVQYSSFSETYSAKTVKAQQVDMGPPPGWKSFQIQPWDQNADKITDFNPAGGLCTFTLKNAGGTVVDTKTETLVFVDLSNASITVNNPNPVWIDQSASMSKFEKGSTPTFSWKLVSLGSGVTIPDGYRLGYSIQVRKGEFQNNNFWTNWGDPDSRIFDSWEKQIFPPAVVGENLSWVVPSAFSSDALYELGLTLVLINKTTNQPIVEGPHIGGVFMVGAPVVPDQFQQDTGWVAPEDKSIADETLNLSGKIHDNIYQRFSSGTPKLGLFRETYSSESGFTTTLVPGAVTSTITDVAMNYSMYLLSFNGSALGTNYGRYSVVLWNDANGDGELTSGEDRDMSMKGIEHREFGTEVMAPDEGGKPLKDSQDGFNFIMWGDSFGAATE